MYSRFIVLAAVVLTASGCSITQQVSPYTLGQASQDLCVVRNSEVVQDGFHDVYVGVLERKGFLVRSLPDKAPVDSCPLLSTYEAIYRWDLAIYLARADLRVYAEGKEAGRAIYDSLSGGANLNKFVRTEPKLTELVDQLFAKPAAR
ncbi:Sbal_3080 family lipoprotein [Variovorax dokdonensis]|uniref:Sbal_3080 family lipoprotein n=1 Tax=Variovorax dokdonensis TaxID=344883 RepID=A0ABT7NAG6_9BURK|nr:Sbal_3080 family lipoprotein [Variovorax dokdonensis]MDM0044933.1 Sbal_3080 family lipoprotein [Variovorax dokdonensis]